MLRGYAGKEWEDFRRAKVEYALPIITAWIRNGRIETECRRRGRPVHLTPAARLLDYAEDLAAETVAIGLLYFRNDVLIPAKWDRTRGASLNTFFVGACVQKFPNVYKAWAREQARHSPATMFDSSLLADPSNEANPESGLSGREQFFERLEQIPERVRDLVLLDAMGYSDSEIAERLNITRKAVETRLRRYRVKR
jgi:DNA-directed RNA polymerase specialized sigma24 family protein